MSKKRTVVFVASALLITSSSSVRAVSHYIKTGLSAAILYSLYRFADGFCDEMLSGDINRGRKKLARECKRCIKEGFYRVHRFCDPLEEYGGKAGQALKDSFRNKN